MEKERKDQESKDVKASGRYDLAACLVIGCIFFIGKWILPGRRLSKGWFEFRVKDLIAAIILAMVAYAIVFFKSKNNR